MRVWVPENVRLDHGQLVHKRVKTGKCLSTFEPWHWPHLMYTSKLPMYVYTYYTYYGIHVGAQCRMCAHS